MDDVLYMDTDGFFYVAMKREADGREELWYLRAIADKLDELNKPMNDHIDNYFKNNPQTGNNESKF